MSDVTDTAPPDRMVSLRIMATTDLHMQVLDYDYLADRPCSRSGLTRIASLVARARAQAPNCLLLDNGDLLQGNPLGDYVAGQSRAGRSVTHPAIAAMNRMGYDAATPGNHDFNYGLPFMRRMLAQAGFPYVAANLCIRGGPDLPSHVILRRQMTDNAGRAVELPCSAQRGCAQWRSFHRRPLHDRHLHAHRPWPRPLPAGVPPA